MASIRREFHVAAPADKVWDALKDFYALHIRLAPGFTTNTERDGDARIVTFGNGMKARETFVGADDDARRLAYSIDANERITRHMASATVVPNANGCTFIWQADVLPDSAAEMMSPMMDAGGAAMKRHLETLA